MLESLIGDAGALQVEHFQLRKCIEQRHGFIRRLPIVKKDRHDGLPGAVIGGLAKPAQFFDGLDGLFLFRLTAHRQ